MNGTHPDDDRLIAYVLEELEASERAGVESHLAECDVCNEVVVALTGAIESLRTSPGPDAPAGILVDLLEVQAASRARPTSRRWLFGPLTAVAAAALLAAFFITGFWAGRQTAPAPLRLAPSAERGVTIPYPLPEPPQIPFQTASAPEGESI